MNPVSDELEAWKCLHSRLAVLGFRPALKRPSRGRAHAWALRTEKTLHLLLLLRLLQCHCTLERPGEAIVFLRDSGDADGLGRNQPKSQTN